MKNKLNIVVHIAGCNVQMKVKNGLTGNSPIVRKDIEPFEIQGLDDGPCNNLRRMKDMVQILLRYAKKIPAVCFRDDQCMPVMDRVDIEDADNPVILIKNLRG